MSSALSFYMVMSIAITGVVIFIVKGVTRIMAVNDSESLLFFVSLPGVQEKLGVMNKGTVYALWNYEAQSADELSFHEGDALTIMSRRDDSETEWWWARLNDKEGYVPRNLLGVGYLYRHIYF